MNVIKINVQKFIKCKMQNVKKSPDYKPDRGTLSEASNYGSVFHTSSLEGVSPSGVLSGL